MSSNVKFKSLNDVIFITASLIYRGFREKPKKNLKITHAILHGFAFLFTIYGVNVAFNYHGSSSPHLQSLHSWIGISAVVIFALQYVVGFACFLLPIVNQSRRAFVLPLHIFFGLFGFVLAIIACLLGVAKKGEDTFLKNAVGVSLIIYGALVVFLVAIPNFKRQPLPEESALLPQ